MGEDRQKHKGLNIKQPQGFKANFIPKYLVAVPPNNSVRFFAIITTLMSSIEALIPGCNECKNYGLPQDCARADWIPEGAFPCGFALRTVKLTITRLLYGREKWTERVLREEANKALLADGCSAEGVAKQMADEKSTQWVIDQGINHLLRKHNFICNVSGSGYALLRYTIEGKENSYSLVYFRVDLPTKEKFTMWPVMFPNEDFNRPDGWRNFFDKNLDREKFVVGEDEIWKNEWEEFWTRNGITYEDWASAVEKYWEVMISGKGDDSETTIALDRTQAQVANMLRSRFSQWQAQRAQVITP